MQRCSPKAGSSVGSEKGGPFSIVTKAAPTIAELVKMVQVRFVAILCCTRRVHWLSYPPFLGQTCHASRANKYRVWGRRVCSTCLRFNLRCTAEGLKWIHSG